MRRWLLVCAVTVLSSSLAPASELTVFTHAGRRLKGEIDPQTDRTWLWLHTSTPGITLRSKTAWSQIASVVADGRELAPEQAIQLAQQEPRSRPEWPENAPSPEPVAADAVVRCVHIPPPRVFVPRAETVESRVVVANWDEDPQPDGIEVEVRPTTWGQPVPIERGAVSVRLYGEPIQDSSRIRILRRNQRATELGRWTVPVEQVDFVQGTAIVRLPFQQIDPFQGRRFSPIGFAQVSLGVNGQGTLRTNTPVVLRDPWQFDAFFPYAHPPLD